MFGQLLLLVQVLSAPVTFDEAKALADQQVASLPLIQSIESDVSLSHAVTVAFKKCGSTAGHDELLTSFEIVLAIGDSGKVQNTWLQGRSIFAQCVELELTTATFPKPVVAPLYKFYSFSVEPSR